MAETDNPVAPGQTVLPPTAGAEPIPADDDPDFDNDVDSAFGGDAMSSTASVSSSILKYRTIHGRTYHSEQGNAKYWSVHPRLTACRSQTNAFSRSF